MPNKRHEVHKVCKIGVFFRKTQRQNTGDKKTLLDVANGKAVCRMSQIFQPFLSRKILILQLCLRPSCPFCVGKILIDIMLYAYYHKIDLKKQLLIQTMRRLNN